MSSINSVSAAPVAYQPATYAATKPKPAAKPAAPTPTPSDRDHDGDVDGAGLDVNG